MPDKKGDITKKKNPKPKTTSEHSFFALFKNVSVTQIVAIVVVCAVLVTVSIQFNCISIEKMINYISCCTFNLENSKESTESISSQISNTKNEISQNSSVSSKGTDSEETTSTPDESSQPSENTETHESPEEYKPIQTSPDVSNPTPSEPTPIDSSPSLPQDSTPTPTDSSPYVSYPEPSRDFQGVEISSSDNLTYDLTGDTLTISGKGEMSLKFLEVANIRTADVKKVVIESGVTSICNNAFESCTNLETVTMADDIKEIGGGAFINCQSLKEVHLSANLTKLGSYAFNGCTALEEITIPDKVTEICNNTFENCTGLKGVHLSQNITEIEDDAFIGCGNLTIYAPKGSEAEKYAANKNNISFTEEGAAVETESSVT